MANLSQVTSFSRKVLEFIGIGTISLIILAILFSVGNTIKQAIAPTPPPSPTVDFGKLPPISFPPSTVPLPSTYTINTLTGVLPNFADREIVYPFQIPQSGLFDLDKAKSIAQAAGFQNEPTRLSDTEYFWTTPGDITTKLTMTLPSFDYLLTSNYMTNPTVVSAPHIPDTATALQSANTFFNTVSPLPSIIDISHATTTLLAINQSTLTPATSLSTAQIIRVDYPSQNINSLPVYTPIPSQSLIYALVASGNTTNPQIVEAQFIHKDISTSKATYPIKTAQEAYNDLKNGKGYIASGGNSSQVSITNVSLGYYQDSNPQKYLMPIIVFQGDNGFVAYVSAIRDEWISK